MALFGVKVTPLYVKVKVDWRSALKDSSVECTSTVVPLRSNSMMMLPMKEHTKCYLLSAPMVLIVTVEYYNQSSAIIMLIRRRLSTRFAGHIDVIL